MFLVFFIFSLTVIRGITAVTEVFDYENLIKFTVFRNETTQISTSNFDTSISSLGCDPTGKFAIVVHGWQQNINSNWVSNYIKKLTYYRGGCVMFMDYDFFAKRIDYVWLVDQFRPIAAVLWKKLKQFEYEGYSADNGYMFGFSFGARLAIEAGYNFGVNRLQNIDVCDPAGLGFYHSKCTDPKLAAKNVQCINTSIDFGTSVYDCHQNWRMGTCGAMQPGTTNIAENHGLCPYLYTSAFDNNFYAVNNTICFSSRLATNVPPKFKMGYMETRKTKLITGDLFALTRKDSPYNVL